MEEKSVEPLPGGPGPSVALPATEVLSGPLGSAYGESMTMAKVFADRLAEGIGLAGAPTLVVRSAQKQFFHYLDAGSEVLFVERAKLLTCFFMAKVTKTQTKCTFVPKFGFRKWLKPRLKCSRANVSLWQMIFSGKKCAPPLTHVSEENNIRQHKKSMDTKRSFSEKDEAEMMESIRDILEPMRELVLKKFLKGNLFTHAPSANASYNTGGYKGGIHCELLDGIQGVFGPVNERECFRDSCPEVYPPGYPEYDPKVNKDKRPDAAFLWKMRSKPYVLGRNEEEYPVVRGISECTLRDDGVSIPSYDEPSVTTGGRASVVCDGYSNPKIEVVDEYSHPKFQASWDKMIVDESIRYATPKTKGKGKKKRKKFPAVRYCTVVEPLKVRGITIGPAFNSYGVKWFQKALFKGLRKLPCFPSMRGQVDATHIQELLWYGRSLGDTPVFGSSDFSGATDGISHRFTHRILTFLVSLIPEPHRSIILNDNECHRIQYGVQPLVSESGNYILADEGWPGRLTLDIEVDGKEYKVKGEVVSSVQRDGNLMGQLTSFPLLCLANLAAHLKTVGEFSPDLSTHDALKTVIINGDDRLAYTSCDFEKAFWKNANAIGLFESVGKSYTHPKYANINSQAYWFDGNHVSRIRVPNLGLLYGQKKVAGEIFNPAYCAGEFASTLPYKTATAFFKRYISLHKDLLAETCRGRNLFLPCHLGGMGQRPPDGWSWSISNRQAMIASLGLHWSHNRQSCYGPSQFPEVSKPTPGRKSAWEKDFIPMYLEECDVIREEISEFERRFKAIPGAKKLDLRTKKWPVSVRCECCGELRKPTEKLCIVCLCDEGKVLYQSKGILSRAWMQELRASHRGRIFIRPCQFVQLASTGLGPLVSDALLAEEALSNAVLITGIPSVMKFKIGDLVSNYVAPVPIPGQINLTSRL